MLQQAQKLLRHGELGSLCWLQEPLASPRKLQVLGRCKVILHNLCVQAALKTNDQPNIWLRGTTYSHTKRSEKIEQLLLGLLLPRGVVVRLFQQK